MKAFISTLLFLSISVVSFSQDNAVDTSFHRSKWTGVIHLDDDMPVMIEFSKDTMFFYMNDQLVEQMLYKKKDGKFILKKYSGVSPCSEADAVYELILSEDKKKMTFRAKEDDCRARALGLGSDVTFTRI